ncbi:hypothetical protein [Streptomyces sp. CB00455]|uniref:hypothetical protein n=1 Tax=Streptomyces sp. CB00455 TaxID=1703927 RepID=UPI00093B6DD7|nr:hypothetical protein [Streptomyces sp. CB00455]
MEIRNRRTAGLVFRADAWAARKAAAQTAVQVRAWGYAAVGERDLEAAVGLLVETAVADGGKRVSLHLADQDDRILVVALSHRPAPAAAPGTVDRVDGLLAALAALGTVVGCGTDRAEDGRRLWALLDATPPRPRAG